MKKKLIRVERRLTADERQRQAAVRAAVEREFPPAAKAKRKTLPGIPGQIQQARQAQGLTWYALAKLAGIPNQATIRDIEQGKDVKVSNLEAVAKALGLKLELVEQLAK